MRIHNTKIIKKARMNPGEIMRYTSNTHPKHSLAYNISFNVTCVYDKEKDQECFLATNLNLEANVLLLKYKERGGIETIYRITKDSGRKLKGKNLRN